MRLKLLETVLAKRRTLSVSLLVLSLFFSMLQAATLFGVLGLAHGASPGGSNVPNVNRSIERFGEIGNITVTEPIFAEPVNFDWCLPIMPIINTPIFFNGSLFGDYGSISLVNMVFQAGHIYIEVLNCGNSSVTVTECWVNNVQCVGVVEKDTTSMLPVAFAAGVVKYLDIPYGWVAGCTYGVKLVCSSGIAFVFYDIAPSGSSGDISSVVLYKANVNFYSVSGVKRIDVDIGNSGTSDTTITRLYVGTSTSTFANQTMTPETLAKGGIVRITIDYNWTAGVTYYFKLLAVNGQSLDWSEQTSSSVEEGNSSLAVVRIEPEKLTVNEGDVFNVSVRIENIPVDHPLAGVQFIVTWNPTVLEAVNATEVMFHAVTPQNEWDNIWKLWDKVNNTEGAVYYAYLWQDYNRAIDGGYAPISGNNMLVTISLKAIGTGSTTLHFSNVEVASPEAQPLIWMDEAGRSAAYSSILKNIIVDSNVRVEKTVDQSVSPSLQNSVEENVNGSLSLPTSNVIQWQGAVQIMGMFVTFGGVAGTVFMLVANSYLVRRKRRKQ